MTILLWTVIVVLGGLHFQHRQDMKRQLGWLRVCFEQTYTRHEDLADDLAAYKDQLWQLELKYNDLDEQVDYLTQALGQQVIVNDLLHQGINRLSGRSTDIIDAEFIEVEFTVESGC